MKDLLVVAQAAKGPELRLCSTAFDHTTGIAESRFQKTSHAGNRQKVKQLLSYQIAVNSRQKLRD